MAKARIMVVEDEELVALAITTCLESAGYEVPFVTPWGEEAVEKLSSASPDLVLMDIRLRGKMNGIEAANAIKDVSHVPVVYLTAYSDADTLEMAKVTDPFGYVLKPYDERTLQATIKMALYKSHAQNELRTVKERASGILQSIGDGIIVASVDGAIEYLNSTAQSLLDIAAHVAPGATLSHILDIVDARSREKLAVRKESVLVDKKRISIPHCLLRTRGGGSVEVDLKLEPYLGERGNVRGMVLTFRDISEKSRIQELVERELEAAIEYHKNLIPPDTERNGVRMSGFLIPASFGAGDLYSFFAIDEEHLGFYFIDVMGHGIAATSTTLLLNRLLSPDPGRGNRLVVLDVDPRAPSRVVGRLNDLFFDTREQMFFTICYGVIDLEGKSFRMARAGHPYPVLLRADGSLLDAREGGFAVGVSPILKITEFETGLAAGDRLFFYSDGVTDCTDARGMQYSRERLLFHIGESRDAGVQEAVSRLKKDVIAWRGQESFEDDVSLMGIQIERI
jgi:PAS domain S-box-containing protein